jgi:tricorn protease interacting factor F2/3
MRDLRYRLRLEVRSDSLVYTGRVAVDAAALPGTLTLDSVGHEVRSVRAGTTPIPFHRPAGTGHELVLEGIPPGSRTLEIEYSGAVDGEGLRGFHLSPLGAGRLYTTYLEPAAARRVLPCLDRPDAKAIFEVEVTAPRGLTVISNTEVAESRELDGGRQCVRFHPTPPMATYLLYLGIGPFEEIRGEGDRPRVILAAAVGTAEKGRFAVVQAERALDYFAKYYAEPYPLPKLHLIAVPQFGTGAMENWGAIAFQEYLLENDERTPIRARMLSVEVVCHEIAHQWFGDLVTMRWWNDLWLNESFATFVATKATAALFPAWEPWDEFLSVEYARALLWDALPHTHPIRVEVGEPDQIRQIFDEISYGKGASVLRMAEAYVGEEAFRAGVSRYLAAHRWGNAESSDLWKAIAAASDPRMERMFETWIERPGHPVVRARWDGPALHLEQSRFSLLPGEGGDPWPIPLQVRDDRTTHRLLFDRVQATVEGVQGTPVINPGRSAFCRVLYEGPLRQEVVGSFERLAPIDRWALVDDGLALLFAGTLDLEAYLEILRRLATETDPLVLAAVVDLSGLRYPLVHRVPRWAEVLRQVVVAQSERLGLAAAPGEPDRTRALREAMTLARVRFDAGFARQLAARYATLDSVEPEVARAVLAAQAITANPETYAELRSRLAATASAERKGQLAGALGQVPRDDWLREGLELVFSGELLIGPWFHLLGSALTSNPERAGAVWAFLSERGDALFKLLAGTGSQGPVMQEVVPLLGIAYPREVRAFVASHPIPDAARALAKGLDLLAVYERVLERAG